MEGSDDIQLLEKFLQDEDLESLEDIVEEFNVFEVLGAVSQEIRHSNFLAWLLDPRGNHGLGDYFLKRFLWKTTSLGKERGVQTIAPIEIDSLELNKVSVRREWRNIDILLVDDAQKFVCAIENKVGTAEHSDQLVRYARVCRNEFPDYAYHFVFLTVHGDAPSDQEWISVDYEFVRDSLERIIHAKEASLGDEVRIFVHHYCNMLRRYIMGESTIEELCQRVYSKHQRALDLIFEYRPDRQSEIRGILERLIRDDPDLELDDCSKGAVHFVPTSWASPHLQGGSGWTKSGRILLFQFKIGPDSLKLVLIIGPGDRTVRSRIFDAVAGARSTFSGASKKLYPMWTQIYKRDFLRSEDYEQHDMEWTEGRIKDRVAAFKATVFPKIDELICGISF